MQRRKNPRTKAPERNRQGNKKSFCCQARFRSVKNVTDAKLEKTSLTTDVFIGPCNRNLFCYPAGFVPALWPSSEQVQSAL